MNRFLFKCNYNPRGSDTHYFGNQLLIHSSVVVLSSFEYNHSNYTPTNRRSLGDPSAEIPDNLGWSLELFQHFYFMSQIPNRFLLDNLQDFVWPINLGSLIILKSTFN